MKKINLIGVLFLIFLLTACNNTTPEETDQTTNDENTTHEESERQLQEDNPIATITMESNEQIIIELFPEIAPNTVANFISLAEEGFYDGLIFHRVIPGFMIQGGDPTGDGSGGPGYSIPGEFTANGFDNSLEHDRGVLSMARSADPDSAGSQFFIMTDKSLHLDGEYAGFGAVLEGMETVDNIVSVETDQLDKPLEDQQIKTIEIDKKGADFPEPTKTD